MKRLWIGVWMLVLLCVCATSPAWAVLSAAQYDALAADITVTHSAEFSSAVAANDDMAISNAYNATFSPTYWVWRSAIPVKEIYAITTADATVWSWTIYIARSVGERDAWRELTSSGSISAALLNVRQGIADIFSGAGGAAQRTHLLTIGRREARRIEQLFATGAGSTATPGVMAYEGTVTYLDIAHALRGVPLN